MEVLTRAWRKVAPERQTESEERVGFDGFSDVKRKPISMRGKAYLHRAESGRNSEFGW